MTTLYIKNMVCNRCIIAVTQLLTSLDLHPVKVLLGEAIISEDLSNEQRAGLDASLIQLGFERLDDRKAKLIESVKNKVIQMIHHADRIDLKFNWSTVLSEHVHVEYNYFSSLFSAVEGITLEQYIIRQKIERVKELLFYDELNLSQIAERLGYSSVAHLSGQFKKITGITPSELKRSRNSDSLRQPLDSIGGTEQ